MVDTKLQSLTITDKTSFNWTTLNQNINTARPVLGSQITYNRQKFQLWQFKFAMVLVKSLALVPSSVEEL